MHDSTKAAAAMESRDWLPLEPYPGAAKPWRCRCAHCAAIKIKRLSHVRKGRARCTDCAGNTISAATAAAIMTAADLEPLTDYPGQQLRPWIAKCLRCGHLGTPTLASVRIRGHQCWACRAAPFPARQPLDEKQAVACMLAHGLQPLDPYPGHTNAPWKSRCITCDNHSTPVPGALPGHHGACPVCARQGINPSEPGYLYLVVHDSLRALGWGVANSGRRHPHPASWPWRPLARWHFAAAQDAWAFGRHLKQRIRSNGCPPVPHAEPETGPARAQTASLDDFSYEQAVRIMEEVAGPAS
ncbi:hypothetical protein ACFYZJ_32230 [Streptomyces sp. NPDC001848]|uniref:hypothetical protein n=1 Tax=Streptomyces sp. NPDC001848 TaxID=3364618 RepID=UPI0036B23E65